MKSRTIPLVIWIVAILSLLLSACNLDLVGSAGAANEPTATLAPDLAPTDPPLPTDEPATPTQTSLPPPSGRILFLSDRDGSKNLYVLDASNGNVTRLTSAASTDEQPRWSPDGARIAFTSTLDNNTDIYLVNADGSGLFRLTDDAAKDSSPTWSPDGQQIAFESYRDGNFELYVVNVDGSGLTRLTDNPGGDLNPQWSPVDRQTIAFVSSNQSGNSNIFLIHPDGSGLQQLTNGSTPSSDPVWSPDGTQIAYRTSSANDQKQICVVGADGSNAHCLTPTGAYGIPVWSRDGSRLAAVATHNMDGQDMAGIDFIPVSGGNTLSLQLKVEPRSEPSWSPDGNYVVFQANQDGNMDLFLLAVSTRELTPLTHAPGFDGGPIWR